MRDGDRLSIDVLGPIRALDADGRDVTPDGALQRRLLALLVLHRGRTVSVDAAIDALWPGGRPRDPVAALHNHLSRLRRCLPEDVVESVGTGYRLAPERIDVDAERLAASLSASDARDPAAAAVVDAVLERWHGPAYPELDDLDDGRAESARLGELRTRAREATAERRLATGAADGLVAELAALAGEEPLRERPRALLMAALAEAGRHRRGAARLRRLPAAARRRARHRAVAGPERAARRPADRHRGDALDAGEPAAPRRHVADRPGPARGRGDGDGRRPPPGHADRPRRGGQDPHARRGRSARCARRGPTGPSSCASWLRPALSRPSTPSPPPCRSTAAPGSG